jgi:alcohol dehydrogenase class IV
MLDLKRTTWNHFSGTQLTFGPDAVTALAGVVKHHSVQRVFVVTDKVLDEAGAVRQLRKVVDQTSAELHVFTDGEVEPSTDAVEHTASIAREFKPDLLVGLGGGSNMDLAKACAAVIQNDCTAASLLGFNNVPGPTAKLVCVPTTSGTGSEVSHSAVLRDSTTDKKAAVLSQHIRPDIAIVDPYMTLSCPAMVTAESGIDALTHAIEAYLATNFFQFEEVSNGDLPYEGNNPFGDMYAEKAIQLIAKNLRRAVEDGENLAARSGMSLAATLAGAAFSNCGVGLCHALEYSIGWASQNCSHGAGNGIVLPEVLRFLSHHRPGKVAKVAMFLNPELAGLPDNEAAEAAIDFICALRRDVGLPCRLTDVGISESQLPELAAGAFARKRLVDLTPGDPTEADGLAILKACL